MSTEPTDWPAKQREVQNHHIDSTRWNDFRFRDGDIVIATWAKAGTTWTQQIISQLIFDGAENVPCFDVSPWIDMRLFPQEEILGMLEAQEHRRFVKTHLPADALPIVPGTRYLYLARDPRDIVWSIHHHHASFTDGFYEALNGLPDRVGPALEPPKEDIVEYFRDWLDGDGYPFWPFWSHVQSWWDIRDLPNVMLLHFNELKADMEGGIRRIADFLKITPDPAHWPAIVEHCTFDYMKKNAETLTDMLDDTMFVGGMGSFINKGTNGRWQDRLTRADIEKYERTAAENLSADCARWLATGEKT